ncbi:copper ion binding protein [Jeotgalicoccus sp. FSL K6-3177]|uniref:copper ion binding protein n=1 Tax=Jeotgalicoccus sp. FSL K6-3177 TaxID=2921494 RepID=UPI0030FDDAD3
MQQVTLDVKGMSCGSCANTIEKSVGELSGIELVKVLLSEGKVDVSYNENTVGLKDIKSAISESGYEITDAPENNSSCSCCS